MNKSVHFPFLAAGALADWLNACGGEALVLPSEGEPASITFIHGALNRCFLPESTERTVARLAAKNGADLYTRHVIDGYGHIDCIFGKSAASDVYPHMLAHLEKSAEA